MSHQRNLLRHMGPPLHKQHSWSPDIYRDEAWLRRKGNIKRNGARALRTRIWTNSKRVLN
ncbi:hypothetical protein EZV62_027996 [Acer yangbiense]|uniref:Uncharacterized protein n=1 Tax=Acer yangbiense TaxID=1000413 RepID=A0A5C7GPQ0_9ROSI|nr:hypothetical protein EZV62_027996 [Acer yangbiense]